MKQILGKNKKRTVEFIASVKKEGGWYVGSIAEVPGVHTQGRTRKELIENLKDALKLVLSVNREISEQRRTGNGWSELPVTV